MTTAYIVKHTVTEAGKDELFLDETVVFLDHESALDYFNDFVAWRYAGGTVYSGTNERKTYTHTASRDHNELYGVVTLSTAELWQPSRDYRAYHGDEVANLERGIDKAVNLARRASLLHDYESVRNHHSNAAILADAIVQLIRKYGKVK